jgi:hypothetical protein
MDDLIHKSPDIEKVLSPLPATGSGYPKRKEAYGLNKRSVDLGGEGPTGQPGPSKNSAKDYWEELKWKKEAINERH